MKARLASLSLMTSSLVGLILLLSRPLLADSDYEPSIWLSGGIFLFALVFGAVIYVYYALAFQTIANKTGTPNSWLAWVPIGNIFLILNVAKKPMWWFLLFFVPIANIVIWIIIWMAVAEARNKPNWWGILMLIPGVNFIVPGYLAWAD